LGDIFNGCLENFYMIKRVVGLSAVLTTGSVLLAGFADEEKSDFSSYSTSGLDLHYIAPNFEELEEANFVSVSLKKDFDGFKEALAFKESRGNYTVINQFGYMGKYQFGKSTLDLIGVKGISKSDFLDNPELQEKAFYSYVSRNKWVLRKDIERYVGKVMNGVEVTESGILAAAHLSGPNAVKRYLRSGGVKGFSDAFGTTIRYYMKRFAGYDMSYVQANQKSKVELALLN